MTRIRRINVSQIEGGDADNTDTVEIRPNGETAFYLDGENRLTLMMFNGTRTHRKSKVLTPGLLYGSNADSGDGNSYDTIKLIPDAELYANSSHQYIIVDPTAPGHIHIRAGGTIDNSDAELIIGGETSHLKIGSGLNPSIYIRSNDNQWTFDGNGVLTLPEGGDIVNSTGTSVLTGGVGVVASDRLTSSTYSVILNGSTGTVTIPNTLVSDSDSLSIASSQYSLDIGRYLRIRDGDVSSHIHIDSPNNATYDLIWGDDYTFVRVDHTGTVVIGTNDGTQREWTFETDGSLRFPNGSLQTTAYTGTNNAATIDITNTNGLTTVYYPTFIETRGAEQTVRADVNLTYRTDDNILGVGAIGFSGGDFRVVNVPTFSTGASGDKEGDIALSSGYIYYCFADFGSAPTETFTVVNVGEVTNVIKVNMAANPNYTVPQAGWFVEIGGVTMTLSAFSGVNGSDFDFLFDNASGNYLPSTVTLTSNTGYTNIWKRLAWSGDTW